VTDVADLPTYPDDFAPAADCEGCGGELGGFDATCTCVLGSSLHRSEARARRSPKPHPFTMGKRMSAGGFYR
jgi:hypothetical protein